MADAFLIIVICVAIAILLTLGIYFIVYYSHPDDRNQAYFPKLVVLGAFVLAGTTVLMLPLDVANNGEYVGCQGFDTNFCGGINMELLWSIFFWLIPIWIFVLIPFSTFYYEAEEVPNPSTSAEQAPTPKQRSRLSQALCNLAVVDVIIILLLFTAYWLLGKTYIPVREYTAASFMEGARPAGVVFSTRPARDENGYVLPFHTGQLEPIQPNDEILLRLVEMNEGTVVYPMDPSSFYAGFMTWVGWWFFALFGGIGLAALPLNGILAFRHRPKLLTPEEMDDLQRFLQDRVNEMVDIGEQLKREREDKEKSQPKRGVLATLFPTFFKKRSTTIRQFKMAVYLLEQDVRDYTAYSIKNEKYNPLYPYIAFFFGIISAIVSLCWILQTLLYTLPNNPVAGFLNNFFEWFDSWFPLFGLLAVAFFTLYLLLCVIKGCFVFGLRFICISFFPMKVGETYMSSFLFNMCLVLLSALPVVNFSVVSFSDYAKHSTIYHIFEVQVDNLSFFGFFFDNDIFIYIFLIVALLTGVILNCRYKQRGQEGIKLQNRLKSRARFVSPSEENTAHVSIPAAPTTTPTSTIDEIENEVFEDEPAPLLLRQQTISDDGGYSVGSNISG